MPDLSEALPCTCDANVLKARHEHWCIGYHRPAIQAWHESQVAEKDARIATLEAELREVRSDSAALQKALVGDTGRSAILEAERLRGIEKGDLVEPRGCAMPGACAALERIAGLKARVTKLEAENARLRGIETPILQEALSGLLEAARGSQCHAYMATAIQNAEIALLALQETTDER